MRLLYPMFVAFLVAYHTNKPLSNIFQHLSVHLGVCFFIQRTCIGVFLLACYYATIWYYLLGYACRRVVCRRGQRRRLQQRHGWFILWRWISPTGGSAHWSRLYYCMVGTYDLLNTISKWLTLNLCQYQVFKST